MQEIPKDERNRGEQLTYRLSGPRIVFLYTVFLSRLFHITYAYNVYSYCYLTRRRNGKTAEVLVGRRVSKEQWNKRRCIAATGNSQLYKRVYLACRWNGTCWTAADVRTYLLQIPASQSAKVGPTWLLQSH